ncbi:MAG: hypothetical protein AAGA53_08155 [Pseudomonadota bacterium]
MRGSKKPLILLLGNYRPSLILARTFKKRGFSIVVGTHGCERLCQYSNAVRSTWSHSPLNSGPETLACELKAFSKANPNLVAIFPVAEEYVRMICENEALFDGLPSIVSMPSGLVRKCLDKEYMLTLAGSVDVPTTPFAYTSGQGKACHAGECFVGYPMIVRPKDSTLRINGSKAICIETEEELIECLKQHDLGRQDLLLQRKFEGKRHNVYFAAANGEVTRLLHAKIERTDKIDGTGLAVEGQTLDTNHDVVEQTRRLVTALGYDGIGCAQFLVNETTGATSFLEINPRIAGNHALPEYAGLDLGWFNFQRVVNKRISRRKISAPSGIRYCWTTGDLMGAKVAFLRKEIGLLTLFAWSIRALISGARSDLHMVFSFKDPYPAITGLWRLIPRIFRWRQSAISPGENTIYTHHQQGKLS